MNRRQFMIAAGAATAGCCGLLAACSERTSSRKAMEGPSQDQLRQQFAVIEAQSGGRLGVAVIDTQSGTQHGYRADERFPMCSTFKLLVAAATLARVDAGRERLDRRIAITQKDLLEYAPVTRKHVGSQMTVAEICEAMMTLSDNTAANLLLRDVTMGPKGLTEFCRRWGDRVTQLDRIEPELNESKPGDPRDTTSPSAMAKNIRRFAFGDVLTEPSRSLLLTWLKENKTGGARIRAGLPADWGVGEKTGTGGNGSTPDVGYVIPPHRPPLVVSVYLTESNRPIEQCEAVIASVAKCIAKSLIF